MKKVKKIKKIPKYSGGILEVRPIDKSGLAPGKITQPDAVTKKLGLDASNVLNKNFGGGGGNVDKGTKAFGGYSNTGIPSGLTTGANEMIKSTFGIDKNSTAEVMMDSTAQGAELGNSVAGPWGALVGAGTGFLLGGLKGDSIDYSKISTTSNIADAYVAGGIFGGGNKARLLQDANQYQNSLVAAEMTANSRADWANDPRNLYAVQTVKNGGVIIGDPSKGLTRVLVDSREVITDKNGNNAIRLPYAEGTDSIPALIQPTYKVFSNGRGFADIAEKIIKGTKEGSRLRQIETNKLAMILEMTKLKKPSNNKILHASEGDIIPYGYDKNLSNFKYWDTKNNNYTKDYLDWVNSITEQDVKDIYSGVYGDMSTYLGKNKNYIPTVEEARKLMTDKKYGDWHKIGELVIAKKNTTPAPKTPLRRVDLPIPDPFGSRKLKNWTQTPNGTIKATIGVPGDTDVMKIPKINPVYTGLTDRNNNRGANWEDLTYEAASILTPLLDREKAETTRLQRPIWKAAPVAVDVLNQLQDAQLSYALANYNTAQGGYTAGQQLAARGATASNLARQRAAIHQWQTEQQNKNIAQNIASYNTHANVLAEIANKETDINAANRAATRNINRQGRATALKNWGQILRNKKQYAMDDVRMAALEPLLQYAYENPEQIKKLVSRV